MNRDDIVAIARTWLGTPYHHQASVKNVGCDCLGLVRGVYREVEGSEPESPPPYTRDWAEASRQETLLDAASRHLIWKDRHAAPEPGDVLLFRLGRKFVCKHAAIVTYGGKMIHAQEGVGTVEVAIDEWYAKRIAAIFVFPQVAPRWQP